MRHPGLRRRARGVGGGRRRAQVHPPIQHPHAPARRRQPLRKRLLRGRVATSGFSSPWLQDSGSSRTGVQTQHGTIAWLMIVAWMWLEGVSTCCPVRRRAALLCPGSSGKSAALLIVPPLALPAAAAHLGGGPAGAATWLPPLPPSTAGKASPRESPGCGGCGSAAGCLSCMLAWARRHTTRGQDAVSSPHEAPGIWAA